MIKKQAKWIKGVEDFYFRVDSAMERNGLLNSIRQGFKLVIPVFVVGAFMLLILNLPIPGYKDALSALWNGALFNFFLFVYNATFGVASLYIVFAVAYKNAQRITKNRTSVLNVMAAITSVICYFALMGDGFASIGLYLPVNNLFFALLTALGAPELFLLLFRLLMRSNKTGRRRDLGGDVEFANAVLSIVPMVVTALAFSLVAILVRLTGFTNLQDLFVFLLSYPFQNLGRSLGGGILMVILQTALWFFGIHGSNVFEDVVNANFMGDGVSKAFLDTFVQMGGSGAMLCLLIALVIFSRNRRNRVVMRSAALPMAFNMNEIMVFGLPIVLNPLFLIPFLITPVVLTCTSYAAMSMGLIPTEAVQASQDTLFWTTPALFSGFFYTGSIAGLLLQVFNLSIGAAIYAPFVILYDRVQKRKFAHNIEEMVQLLRSAEQSSQQVEFFALTNHLYPAATEFAQRLHRDIDGERINLFYQPLVNDEGVVVAAEALMRWGIEPNKFCYPPLIVGIAKEDGSYDALTKSILLTALNDARTLNLNRKQRISISVNIQIDQLTNEAFIDWLIAEITARGLQPGDFSLEITEESALSEGQNLAYYFSKLRDAGVPVSLDDFSMGHTSINYLQQHLFDKLKLDGGLVRNMLGNTRSQEIVESVVRLGNSLGITIVAEYVESEQQRDMLHAMGCNLYQGWLYSPAIDFDRFVSYADAMNNELNADIIIPGI